MAIPASYIRHTMPVGTGLISDRWFTWILDNHWDFTGAQRTSIGQLVYESKYKNNPSAIRELEIVARHSVLQISKFSSSHGLSVAECVIAIPSSSRPHDDSILPRILARAASEALEIPDSSHMVSITPGLAAAKSGAVRTASDFLISANLTFEKVLLVDDLLSTGQTMLALGECLVSHESSIRVSGLALTKVQKGLGN